MSLHRRNPRRDRNERLLVDLLRKSGALVAPVSGEGVPDLLVGYRGRWLLLEVKGPKGKLTAPQILFHGAAAALNLPCYTVSTPADVQRVLAGLRVQEQKA